MYVRNSPPPPPFPQKAIRHRQIIPSVGYLLPATPTRGLYSLLICGLPVGPGVRTTTSRLPLSGNAYLALPDVIILDRGGEDPSLPGVLGAELPEVDSGMVYTLLSLLQRTFAPR